jgi:transcriptional regulator with XRE-family HTH domain
MRDVSQEQLARQVGIAPQQIQKYEKGETRISASRLYDFATLFEVPIVYFFDGLEGSAGPEDVLGGRRDVPSPLPIEAPGQEAVARLLANYDVLSPRLQLKLVEIARVMAEIEAGPDD